MGSRKKIIIFGCSGHAHVAADILSLMPDVQVVGFLGESEVEGTQKYGLPVFGSPEHLDGLLAKSNADAVLVAIGDNAIRAKIASKLIQQHGESIFASAVHPAATISARSELESGCLIAAGAVVGPGSHVGFGCILNTNASLDHDSVMGRFASLAPNAVTGGNVSIGKYSAIGIGASVNHGVDIGDDVVIGGGAVVINDIKASTLAFGVPAVVRERRAHGDRYL